LVRRAAADNRVAVSGGIHRTDDAEPPVMPRLGQLVDDVLDDLEQRFELPLRPQDIVDGEQLQRDQLHLRFLGTS
jgi:hypothetical protein